MKVILRLSDTQINDDEYVRYKEAEYYKIHFEEMPKYLKEEARNEFKQMDTDQTGTIDWWEFLNHEALKQIAANRSKFQLVKMLSPREIQKARDIFHAFDKDEDGYINSHEVAVGFNRCCATVPKQ
ncbi:PREDICTED: PHD finger protein 24-like [Acropora digitifera]|uniref:PHD finger protein 24-like n=1 Tax=Acropora digitifera TaxID=70779 RepID=UPI00077ACFFC|nr:PREDICTED: PHD finger protein 24-like [Acropora digitifera]